MAIRNVKDRWLVDVSIDGKRKTAVFPRDTHKDDLELAEARLKLELLEARSAEAHAEVEQKSGRGWTLEAGYRNSLRTRKKWQTAEQLVTIEKRWRVVSKYISPQLLLTELDTERLDEFVQEVMDDRPITAPQSIATCPSCPQS
jgi:hypothetical protein